MNSDFIMRGSGVGEIINHNFGGASENMIKILEAFKYREFSAICQRGTSLSELL